MITTRVETKSTETSGVSARVIVSGLRQQILAGNLRPGDRLPTRSEIEADFGASRVTVQRALDELRREGWVEVNGRQGTYVTPNPPHLTRYALIFPHIRAPFGRVVSFWSALAEQAEALNRTIEGNISVYFGVDGHEDAEDYQRLVREVHGRRLAGLIFGTQPGPLRGTPLLEGHDIPMVAIMSSRTLADVSIVGLDADTFFNRSLDWFVQRGRKRVAFLTSPLSRYPKQMNPEYLQSLGLMTRPYWHLLCNQSAPEAAQHAMHLLFNPAQHERPDALIITDDHLVECAVKGVMASGVRIQQDVDIIGHCNFPNVTPSPVPIQRLGFDAKEILRTCLSSIEQQRSGVKSPAVPLVPAFFESEISKKSS